MKIKNKEKSTECNKNKLWKYIIPLVFVLICIVFSILDYQFDDKRLSLAKDISFSLSIPISITFAFTFNLTKNMTKIDKVIVNEENRRNLNNNDKELYSKFDKSISNITRHIDEEKKRREDFYVSSVYESISNFLDKLNSDIPSHVFADDELNKGFVKIKESCLEFKKTIRSSYSNKIACLIIYNIVNRTEYCKIRDQIANDISSYREIYRKKCD